MKNIVFLVFLLNSFAFSYDSPNPATDKLTLTGTIANTCLASIDHPINTYFYQDSNHATCLKYTSTIYTSTLCPDGKKYNKYSYSVYLNYPSCPSGQEIINGVCAVPPTCATGTIWNPLTDTCEYDPNTADGDGNGIPNKCDPDYVDYLTMDCDGDGQLNTYDGDIDGDGILNGNDPTPYGANSGTADTPCGATSYSLTSVKDQGSCSMDNPLFNMPDGELRYVSNVMWDDCRKSCMVLVKTCPYGQAIKDGICTSLKPDEGSCLGTSSCGIVSWGVSPSITCVKKCNCLTTLHPVPSATNEYFNEIVSCAEQPTEQDKLDDLRQNSDVNKTLPSDLLKDSNATASLDVSASMKVALDSYAGSKEATQLELLSESKIQSLQLVSANTNLKNIESSLEKFSAVSTSNDGVINSSLQGIKGGIDTSNGLLGSIDGKMTTNNSLLGDIKGLLGDLNTSGGGDSNITIGGTSFSDKHEEGEQQAIDRGNIDGSLTQIYTFLNNVSNDFTNLKNMLDGGITSPSISSGIAPTFCVTVFNRQICINLCESFGQFYSIFYYIFTSLFLLVALKIYYLAFKMRF